MDILDDFPEKKNNDSVRWNYFRKEKPIPESEQLKDHERKELTKLVGMCVNRVISTNEYYRRLAEFWNEVGEPEYAKEALLKVED
jgi:hypothetical protein